MWISKRPVPTAQISLSPPPTSNHSAPPVSLIPAAGINPVNSSTDKSPLKPFLPSTPPAQSNPPSGSALPHLCRQLRRRQPASLLLPSLSLALDPSSAASHRHHSLCRTASISQPPSPSTISAMSAASLLGHVALRPCPRLSPRRFQKPIPAAIGTDLPVPRFQVATITVAPIPRRAAALIQRRRRRSPSLAATDLSSSPLSVPDKREERNCSKKKS
ncbi:hypothetical protein M0R45_000485 [Rubus argutus]|uniref:Uncharacterized protein n=1 Tax=Rubus argutus TaxID=59490 RepID=A0AAW1VPC5_RUBAR